MKIIIFSILALIGVSTSSDIMLRTNDKHELIIVFQKGVSEDVAGIVLEEAVVEYRRGSDSSRGKRYFYKTGPKYIVTFSTKKKKEAFLLKYQDHEKIYEIYTPNWKTRKD